MGEKLLWWIVIISQIYAPLAQATSTFVEQETRRSSNLFRTGNGSNTVVQKGEGIEITTDKTTSRYQAISESVPVKEQCAFEFSFEIDLKSGGFGIGLKPKGLIKSLAYKTYHTLGLIKDTIRLPFGASEKDLYIVFTNNVPTPGISNFFLKKYTITQPALPVERALQPCVANKVEWKETGIDVTTNNSQVDYQLRSKPIPISENSMLELPFEVDLQQGGFAVGLLTEDHRKFLAYKFYHTLGLVKDSLRLPFGTTEKRVLLIFANHTVKPGESHFIVKDYTLNQIPLSPERILEGNGTNTLVRREEGLDLTTDKTTYRYQAISKPIPVKGQSAFELSFEVDHKSGGFGIGLKTTSGKYLIYKTYPTSGIIKDTLKLPDSIPESHLLLVLANHVPTPEVSHFI